MEKGKVDQLRSLLSGSESPSELASLLQLACARAETRTLLRDSEGPSERARLSRQACKCSETRVELVELLLDKGADPSAVGDCGSALWLAVAQAPGAIVSTLLKKATQEQRVAAARTLCSACPKWTRAEINRSIHRSAWGAVGFPVLPVFSLL